MADIGAIEEWIYLRYVLQVLIVLQEHILIMNIYALPVPTVTPQGYGTSPSALHVLQATIAKDQVTIFLFNFG